MMLNCGVFHFFVPSMSKVLCFKVLWKCLHTFCILFHGGVCLVPICKRFVLVCHSSFATLLLSQCATCLFCRSWIVADAGPRAPADSLVSFSQLPHQPSNWPCLKTSMLLQWTSKFWEETLTNKLRNNFQKNEQPSGEGVPPPSATTESADWGSHSSRSGT